MCKCGGKKEDEGSFMYTMRLLAIYEFPFRDLGLKAEDADQGLLAIRHRFLELLSDFADKNETQRRQLLQIVGKPAVNFFKYDPPDHIFYVSVWSSAEFGWSGAFKRTRWLRTAASLFQIRGVIDVFTTKAVAFVPAIGFDAELLPLSSALLQLRLGLRVGYQLSTSGGFTEDSCRQDGDSSATIFCSYPLLQGLVAASFYERVRLHLGLEWSPPWFPGIAPKDHHWITLIAGLGWQWISPF
jgi:hypothetical protein